MVKTRTAISVWCLALLLGLGCQKEKGGPVDPTPASEHPGKPLKIPEPEKGRTPAVGQYQRQATAEERNPSPPPKSVLMGPVESKNRGSLRIKDQVEGEQELRVDGRTVVMHERTPISVDDFKPGDEVTASYVLDGNVKVATRIDVVKKSKP